MRSRRASGLMRRAQQALALLLTIGASAADSSAQQATERRFSPGIGGGFSRGPGGAIGYQALATLEVRTGWSAARLRVDGMFAEWGVSYEPGPVTSLTLNAGVTPVEAKEIVYPRTLNALRAIDEVVPA